MGMVSAAAHLQNETRRRAHSVLIGSAHAHRAEPRRRPTDTYHQNA